MKTRVWIITAVFAILFGLKMYWVYGFGGQQPPEAVRGVLDLREWTPDARDVVPLRGEWFFEASSFSDPGKSSDESDLQYVRVPGKWDDVLSRDKPTPYGYGTYRLVILLPEAYDGDYGVYVQRVRTAYKLFANGAQVGQEGVPGESRSTSVPQTTPYKVNINPQGQTLTLTLQTSNFHYGRLGGIFDDIQFGSNTAIDRYVGIRDAGNNVLIGFYLVNGLYFTFLFAFRRRNKELLYFGTMFWMFLLFWATHGQKLLYELFPGIGYDWQTKLQTFSSFGAFLSMLLFANAMFPGNGHRFGFRAAIAITGVFSAFTLLTDVSVYSRFELLLISADTLMFVYTVYIIARAGFGQIVGPTYAIVAAFSLLLESLSQAFTYLGFSPVNSFPPLERVAFVICMALLIAKRFFTGMEQVEFLSKKLIALDRLKSDFLANTSQEIRQPLHGMINLAQLMLDEGDTKERRQEERLSLIVATGRKLAHLLNDLLDLSKLNDGKVELQPRAVDVRMTINGALEVMHYMTGDRSVRFENRTPPGLPPVLADGQRLMQILFSLLHYAIKAGAEGTVAVAAEPDPKKDGFARVVVRASRSGSFADSPEAEPEADFSLEISRKLVEMHGGRFYADASSPSAIVLAFTLPTAPGAEESGEAADEFAVLEQVGATAERLPIVAENTPDAASAAESPRVLIVDDDPVGLQVMADILAKEGLSVSVATDGLQGLRMWEKETEWELVVMGVMLPGLSGYDLCRKIRERHSFYDLPVLFLTSRNQTSDLLVGFNAGANDYVVQPIDVSEFRARTRTLLRMKQSIRDQLHLEMALIQAQIKPHFLYNTLNTIASLSEIDPERTRELLNDFGRYLRNSFDIRNLDRAVPFSKEWALVESYLQIEQARFGNRIEVTTEVPNALSFSMPPLTIQPIVENALRHGILTRFEGGSLHIEVISEKDGVDIVVRDNGVGMSEERIEEVLSGAKRGGIGLINVHRRLINAYGKGLAIASEVGVGTEVRFRIPLAKEETA